MKAITHHNGDRARAWTISLLFHALLLLLLFLWRITIVDPPKEAPPIVLELEWGGGGDDAALGEPDRGQGNDPAPQGQQMETPAVEQPVEKPSSKPAPPVSSAPSRSNTPQTSTPTVEDPSVAAIRKQQEDARRRQQAEDQARVEQANAEAARKQREQAEKDAKKGKFGSTFGQGSGSGQGNTGKPGNQGQPNGTGNNPNGTGPGTGGGQGGGSGTGTGSSIGGGLGGRKLLGKPKMVDNSQKSGKVNVEVCVNKNGEVISADFTQRGSTTSDSELRNKAISWAKQHKFGTSANEKECGTILFNFQLQ
ncbi:MAG: hypothetical protein ACOYNO_01375 [Saprospiraceae bacterium]